MQILINLITNAQQALVQTETERKKIWLRLSSVQKDRISIEVADNGAGIDPDNLTSIFQHGFTTRADGYGFGLHSSAIAAQEMEGSLFFGSRDPG